MKDDHNAYVDCYRKLFAFVGGESKDGSELNGGQRTAKEFKKLNQLAIAIGKAFMTTPIKKSKLFQYLGIGLTV